MPRPSSINIKRIFEELKIHSIFDDNNELKQRSDSVWCEAAKHLHMTTETLNSYVRQNRYNLLDDLKKHNNILIDENSTFFSTDSEIDSDSSLKLSTNSNSDEEYDIHEPKCNNSGKLPKLLFDVKLTEEEWQTIHPISKVYKDNARSSKTYTKLKKGWTDLLSRVIFKTTKLPCAYTFKYAKVFPEGIYLKIHGICNECETYINGHCIEKPTPGTGITITIETLNTCGIPHDKKRALKGDIRKEVGQHLLMKKPRQYRHEAVCDLSFGDPEPPYLPRKATLRKVKENATNEHLKVEKTLDPIESLYDLKYNGKYVGYIQSIGKDPFYCIYGSPMQLAIYKTLLRKHGKILIDATGSLVKSIKKKNGDKKHIFLYQMIMKGDDSTQPIFQMITERNDVNQITFWLREHIRYGARIPRQVVVDFSLALLNSCALAYNDRHLKLYLEDCFRCLEKQDLQHPLSCFIRVDIAHLIKMIAQNPVFRGKHVKVKDFFVRCVALMSSCNDIMDFNQLLTSILIVALSEYDGQNEDGENIISTQKQEFLFEKIKTFTTKYEDYPEKRDSNVDFPEEAKNITEYINNIELYAKEKVSNIPETSRLNPYYIPNFTKQLLNISKSFPLWTNVMVNYFSENADVASTASCEAYFKDLKYSDLNREILRADKFVIKHIRSIESLCKFEQAAQKKGSEVTYKRTIDFQRKKPNKKAKTYTDVDSVENCLNIQENWRGKNENLKNNESFSPDEESEKSIRNCNNFLKLLNEHSSIDNQILSNNMCISCNDKDNFKIKQK